MSTQISKQQLKVAQVASIILLLILFVPTTTFAAVRSGGGVRTGSGVRVSAPKASTPKTQSTSRSLTTSKPKATTGSDSMQYRNSRTYSSPDVPVTVPRSSVVPDLLMTYLIVSALSPNVVNAQSTEEVEAVARDYCKNNYDPAVCKDVCLMNGVETGRERISFWRDEVTYTRNNVCKEDDKTEYTQKKFAVWRHLFGNDEE